MPEVVEIVFEGDAYATVKEGTPTVLASRHPDGRYEVFFEDDGETAYFYAIDKQHQPDPVVEAGLVYDVTGERENLLEIFWAEGRHKALFLANESPQAAVDFDAQRMWCRSGFPLNSPWNKGLLDWSDEALEGFGG